ETRVPGWPLGVVGLKSQPAAAAIGSRWTKLAGETIAVVAVVVVVRLLYLLPSVLLARNRYRHLQTAALADALQGNRESRRLRRARSMDVPLGWREAVVVW